VDDQRKKELKNSYKLTPPNAGVFKITNKANGKIFVSSSLNLKAIFNRLKTELRFGSCRIRELQNDWNSFGAEQFTFDIVEIVEPDKNENAVDAKSIKTCEELWLYELKPYGEIGYNKEPAPK